MTAYRRILVPYDGSATAEHCLEHALALAATCGADLRVVHVLDEFSFARALHRHEGHPSWEAVREDGMQILALARAKALTAGANADVHLLDTYSGPVHDMLIEEARVWNADVIVMGSHGRSGVHRLLLGSCAENVARSASIPVIIVRAPVVEDTGATS